MKGVEYNKDLFDFKGLTIEEVDNMADEDERNRWPEDMRQLYDLLRAVLDDAGIDKTLALTQLISICKTFGGMQFYLPRGDNLRHMILKFCNWNDFTGNNVRDLAQKYKVSENHIYRVIKVMRNREVKKRQQNLF